MIGVGSFGRHHARIYAHHPDATLVGVWDSSPERVREVGRRYGCDEFSGLDALLAAVDAVSVVTPAASHAEIAMQCLDRGVHVLVEKPIATTVDGARRCVALAENRKCVFQVGHLERFNSAVVAVQKTITTPYFIDSYRLSPFPDRSLDVDVVLDLMIHDLDILLWLVESEVEELQASGVRVRSSQLDVANARIVFRNGCIANVSSSRVSEAKVRVMTLAQPESVLHINHATGTVHVYPRMRQAGSSEKHLVSDLTGHDNEPLWRELDSFLRCVRQRTSPLVSGHDGLAALQLAQHVVTAIHSVSPEDRIISSTPHACDVRIPPLLPGKALSASQG